MKIRKQIFFRNVNNQELNEALRIIRTNLYFLNEEKNSRIILVTSSIPKEGKSVVASNYAMNLAAIGEKVLLVDCNIRRPVIHKNFNLFFDKGLESVLLGEYKAEYLILKNIKENLDILPTKIIMNNTIELFLGEKIKMILQELKEKYTTIVLDTPSLIISSDAAILSKYCEGIVYVVGYNQVTKRELEFGKTILDNAKANIYGFVVNRVDKNRSCNRYNGYYTKDYYTKKTGIFGKISRFLK